MDHDHLLGLIKIAHAEGDLRRAILLTDTLRYKLREELQECEQEPSPPS